MTMPNEEVQIDPQQVSNGLAQWDQAASNLNSRWQTAVDRIAGLNAANPWGGDAAGSEFRTAYDESGGLDVATNGKDVVKQVVDLGPRVRTAAENSLASDEAQGRVMDIEVEGL